MDPANRAPRSWFDPTATPVVRPPFAPREVVRQLLQQSAEVFRWPSGLADLRDAALVERPHGWSAGLTQEFKGLPRCPVHLTIFVAERSCSSRSGAPV